MAEGVRTTDFPLVEAADELIVNDISAGGTTGRLPVANLAEQLAAGGPISDRLDEIEDLALAGARSPVTVRVIATANVALANGLENGDTVDGVVLATGDVVVLAGQADPIQNGAYVVVASGAASRHPDYNDGTELVGAQFAVLAGTRAGQVWAVREREIVLGATPITITFALPTNITADGSIAPAKLAPQTANRLLGYDNTGVGAVIDPATLPVSTATQAALDAKAGSGDLTNKADRSLVVPINTPAVPGWARLNRDSTGKTVESAIKEPWRFLDFRNPQGYYVTNVPGWRYLHRDRTGKRIQWGKRFDGEIVFFGMRKPEQVVVDSGGSGATVDLTYQPFGYGSFEEAEEDTIEDVVGSWWCNRFVCINGNDYAGLVGMPRGVRDQPGYTEGPIVVSERRANAKKFKTFHLGRNLTRSDDHNAPGLACRIVSGGLLALAVGWAGHASGSPGRFYYYSRTDSFAGLSAAVVAPSSSGQTYNQVYNQMDDPTKEWRFFRHSSTAWRLEIFDTVTKQITYSKPVFGGTAFNYPNVMPRLDSTNEFIVSWHVNPGEGGGVGIAYLRMRTNGDIMNLAGTVIVNVFADGYDWTTQYAKAFTQGTIIVPNTAGQLLRHFQTTEVEANVFQTVYQEWTDLGDGSAAEDDTSKVKIVTVNCGSSYATPTITIKDVCKGGTSIHVTNTGYIGGASLVGKDLVVASGWFPTTGVPGWQGRIDLYDTSGSEGYGAWPTVNIDHSTQKIFRPEKQIEIYSDGASLPAENFLKYKLGPKFIYFKGNTRDTVNFGYRDFFIWDCNAKIKLTETYVNDL
ncbi:hypothetical protein QBK99_10955 [Corticibacterium sp. UT-5YL-CI-8]|nr:hypothetical protein [Tianweitania sp. UT-5YL-CI-8]